MADGDVEFPDGSGSLGKAARGTLQVVGRVIPIAGGLISATAGAWGEQEQEKVNAFFKTALELLKDDLREKEETLAEVAARIDLTDKKVEERVRSGDYRKLLRKALRNWAGAESRQKREYIRNVLANSASARLTSDDVIDMFLTWLHSYSELHFVVIGDLYQHPGTTRGQIWRRTGSGSAREDSAEADLFKLLFRDLSTGSVIRQHREVDYHGNFVPKERAVPRPAGSGPVPPKSAFDEEENYALTSLGQQFVHYAMTDITTKLTFTPAAGM